MALARPAATRRALAAIRPTPPPGHRSAAGRPSLARRLHKPGGWLSARRPVTTWWLPGKDRRHHGVVRDSDVLRVPQRGQAARRAADPGDHPCYSRHDNRPARSFRDRGRSGGRAGSGSRIDAATAGRGALRAVTLQLVIPDPGGQKLIQLFRRSGFPARLRPRLDPAQAAANLRGHGNGSASASIAPAAGRAPDRGDPQVGQVRLHVVLRVPLAKPGDQHVGP